MPLSISDPKHCLSSVLRGATSISDGIFLQEHHWRKKTMVGCWFTDRPKKTKVDLPIMMQYHPIQYNVFTLFFSFCLWTVFPIRKYCYIFIIPSSEVYPWLHVAGLRQLLLFPFLL